MKPLQFATVGTSMITERCLEALSDVKDAAFYGAYSRDTSRAAHLVEKYHGTSAWVSYEELLEAKEVDAVYIASPNSLHAEQVEKAILAGKHVLCEKPLTSYKAKTAELFELASKKGVILMEAMRLVHDPNYQTIKEEVKKLGEIGAAHLHFSKHSSRYDELKAGALPNIFNAKFETGALADLGIYPVEAALFLFGRPLSVSGVSLTETPSENWLCIDVAGAAILRYPTFLCTITYSKVVDDTRPCSISCERDEIFWEYISQPRRIWLGCGEVIPLKAHKRMRDPEVGNMEFELRDFVKAVRKHETPAYANAITADAAWILEELRQKSDVVFGG